MGSLQQKMARFWSMSVDEVIADSQQNPKETPHKHIMKEKFNHTGETLISDMLKNLHEAWETLEATKSTLQKATLAASMESKVPLEVTRIRNKIQVAIFLLIC